MTAEDIINAIPAEAETVEYEVVPGFSVKLSRIRSYSKRAKMLVDMDGIVSTRTVPGVLPAGPDGEPIAATDAMVRAAIQIAACIVEPPFTWRQVLQLGERDADALDALAARCAELNRVDLNSAVDAAKREIAADTFPADVGGNGGEAAAPAE